MNLCVKGTYGLIPYPAFRQNTVLGEWLNAAKYLVVNTENAFKGMYKEMFSNQSTIYFRPKSEYVPQVCHLKKYRSDKR